MNIAALVLPIVLVGMYLGFIAWMSRR